MTFDLLRLNLLDRIRSRIYNGELTERGLARLADMSQPHLHNVLKGKRSLSVEMADQLLYYLQMSVVDLIDPQTLQVYLSAEYSDNSLYSCLPVLRGRIGPSAPWPTSAEGRERFPVPSRITSRMWHPVVARLADDPRMYPLFSDGDLVLLDQSQRARTTIDPEALYAIKSGESGVIRKLRRMNDVLVILPGHGEGPPENIPADPLSIAHFVRAKATLIGPEREWETGAGQNIQDFRAA